MSTYFRAGGAAGSPGHWWRMVHTALDAGADLNALRLIHVAGAPALTPEVCVRMESRLGAEAACVVYDPASLLVIEPGLDDHTIAQAVCDILRVTSEQLRLWCAVAVHEEGLDFRPVPNLSLAPDREHGPASPPVSHDVVLTDAEFSYLPVWNIAAGEIYGYVCETVWSTPHGQRVTEDALAAFFAKPRHVFALDREALHKTVGQVQDFLDRYMFANMMIPVHYSTLADPVHRDAYLMACNESIWSVMDNIYFEITRVPANADATVLQQSIDALTPYGQGVMLRVERGFSTFQAFDAESILSVGLDFHYDDRPDQTIGAELTQFAEACLEAEAHCHAHNLRNMDTCITAASAGYTYISSSTISPPLDMSNPEDDMIASSEVLRALMRKQI